MELRGRGVLDTPARGTTSHCGTHPREGGRKTPSHGTFVASFLREQREPASMIKTIRRREFIAGLGAGLIAAPGIVRAEGEPVVIRAGALKLIHSIAPYFYEQFAPARLQGRGDAVREPDRGQERRRHQVGRFRHVRHRRRHARRRGGRAGRGDRRACNKGMAVIAKKDSGSPRSRT